MHVKGHHNTTEEKNICESRHNIAKWYSQNQAVSKDKEPDDYSMDTLLKPYIAKTVASVRRFINIRRIRQLLIRFMELEMQSKHMVSFIQNSYNMMTGDNS